MIDDIEPGDAAESEATLSRRRMLRQIAAVGAATVWATPVVQSIGSVPAFATGTPPPAATRPPPPPPSTPRPRDFVGISHIALVFTIGGTPYRAKWREGVGFGNVGGRSLPRGPQPAGWRASRVYPSPGDIGVETTYVDGELYSVTFTLPPTCTAAQGSGVVKRANPRRSTAGGHCLGGVAGSDPRRITFTAPSS